MARISLDPPRSLTGRLASWYSHRRFGTELEPARAMAHNPKVLKTSARSEMSVDKWSAAPAHLKHLAVMAAAATIGCEWCVDFGYWIGMDTGVDPAKVHDLAQWRDSDAYTDLERAVIEYAEAASTTPVTVTDAMVAGLLEHLDEAALVETTAMIAIENQRARFNSSLGLASQGFSDRCELRPTPSVHVA